MRRPRICLSWFFVLVLFASVEGVAQVTGVAADFRSDAHRYLGPVVNGEVTHSDYYDGIGVRGYSVPQPYVGYGGYFVGGYKGVYCDATAEGTGWRYAVDAFACCSDHNFGVRGAVVGEFESTNYGVYGDGVCVEMGCTAYGVYSDGDLAYTGSLIGPPSDLMFKEAVEGLDSALSGLLKLEVVTYQHKLDPRFEHMNLSKGQQTGFVAQQVAEVFPDLVVDAVHPAKENRDRPKEAGEPIRYKALKMTQLIPILVRAIQEQQDQIEELRAEIAPLRRRLVELQEAEQGSPRTATVLPTADGARSPQRGEGDATK